ncbi:dihydropteroate synthase [soil metagenome]
MHWRCGRFDLDLAQPLVMGIVNVTSDSFSDGGRFLDASAAIAQAHRLAADGADLLDLGAESTRPGATPVSADQEIERLLPILEGLRALTIPISIDTYKPAVMRAVLDAGAAIINDIQGFASAESRAAVADSECGVCVMHMQGAPLTMQQAPAYSDVVAEVGDWLAQQGAALEHAGVAADRIVVDPGFGFGKAQSHNLALLQQLDRIVDAGRAVLIGVSRKSMIGHLSGRPDSSPAERVAPSVAAALFAVGKGARIVRVHDVRDTVDALHLWQAANGQRIAPH